jgi:carboxypeptidase family protein
MTRRVILETLILSFLILFRFPAVAVTQTTAGSISGVVTDRAGAVIPGAKVFAESDETGQRYTGVTGGQGQYLLYPLPPGSYSLTVSKENFRVQRVERLKVSVADHLTSNIALEVAGQVVEQVTITAGAESEVQQVPVVQSTILREQITTLPLNARDYNQLILLTAGAVENIGSGNGRDFGAVAVNGNRAFSNDYLLDGAPNNDLYQGLSALPVSVDVIGEFKVTSNVAPAEYGQAGTQVSVITRRGSNQFRGSLLSFTAATLSRRATHSTWAIRRLSAATNSEARSADLYGCRATAGAIVRSSSPTTKGPASGKRLLAWRLCRSTSFGGAIFPRCCRATFVCATRCCRGVLSFQATGSTRI